MPRLRDLANVHSIRPTRAIPKTSRPRCCSNEGVHGTRLNPIPSSIMAKRPDARSEALAINADDARRLRSDERGARCSPVLLVAVASSSRRRSVARRSRAKMTRWPWRGASPSRTRCSLALHRRGLLAEAARAQRHGIARHELTIEPSGATGLNARRAEGRNEPQAQALSAAGIPEKAATPPSRWGRRPPPRQIGQSNVVELVHGRR